MPFLSITKKRLLSFIVPAAFLIIVLVFVRFEKVFTYNLDEGLNLMRAYLHAKGYILYQQIRMDQPPVFALLFSGLFKVFGPSVFAARMLVLFFSSMLLWAVYKIVSKAQNTLSGIFAVVLIIFSSFYVKMSISAMNSIPAISLAMLSVYAAFLYRATSHKRYLLISGILFAVAVLTRFFSLIFLPAIIWEIAMARKKKAAYPAWILAFTIVFLYIATVATRIDFSQLLKPYLLARGLKSMPDQNIRYWLLQEYDIILLAICSFIFLRRQDRKNFIAPLITLILGLVVFSNHSPRWYHHRLWIIIPLSWVASFGFYTLYDHVKKAWKNKGKPVKRRPAAVILILGIAVIFSLVTLPFKYGRITSELQYVLPDHGNAVALMKKYRSQTNFVVTDMPIIAFYADIPVHPYLASVSPKMMRIGLLTASDYLKIIREEHPGLIFFERFEALKEEIAPYLQKDYALEYESKDGLQVLYVSKKIKERIKLR